jgi:peptide/nickel transport system permease protein
LTAFGARLGYRINAVGVAGAVVVMFWAVVALFAPCLLPHSIGEIIDADYFGPMSRELWLGSDYLGRDMLSRILMGARYTVGISLVAVAIACVSGVTLGMTAAITGA